MNNMLNQVQEKPTITTYSGTEEQVKLALNAGAEHLILEDSKLSCRSYTDDFKTTDFSKIETLANLARSIKHDVTLSFNCDTLIHHRHFERIKTLIKHLKNADINRIRVQDIGVRLFIEEHYPNIICDLATETGNQNLESIAFHSTFYKSQTLSVEMPYSEIEKCKPLLEKNNETEFEIQVQGPILIQYSNRRYMAGFKSQSGLKPVDPDTDPIIKKVANDEEFPTRLYPFYDNPHGHFMYLFYDRCLINQVEKLKNLPLHSWLIDARGESNDYLSTTLRLYKQAKDHYFKAKHNSNSTFKKETALAEIKNVAQRPQRPGFFLANKTDQDLSKITKLIKKEGFHNPLGTIVDYTKGKWVVVELKSSINSQTHYTILTPESKVIHCETLHLRDLQDQDITKTDTSGLVKVKWQKGMLPKSNIYNNSL